MAKTQLSPALRDVVQLVQPDALHASTDAVTAACQHLLSVHPAGPFPANDFAGGALQVTVHRYGGSPRPRASRSLLTDGHSPGPPAQVVQPDALQASVAAVSAAFLSEFWFVNVVEAAHKGDTENSKSNRGIGNSAARNNARSDNACRLEDAMNMAISPLRLKLLSMEIVSDER